MAKELPYFKFEPNQWENGNIQMLSREDKGLFIDLCSMYWSRLGDLKLKLAVQKLCDGNATALNSLYEDEIIAIEEGFIRIDFLEEQLIEFKNTSSQNSKNAKDGWDKRRNTKALSQSDAVALIPQSESDAIREEKRREEKIKEEKKININTNTASPFKFFDSLIYLGGEKQLVSDWIAVRKLKKLTNTLTAFENFKIEVSKSNKTINEVLKECVVNSWGGFKAEWINKNNVTSPTKKRVIS